MTEYSVVIIKSDSVQRGLIGEFISRFERVGIKIVAMKMVWIDKKTAFRHYGVNEEWYEMVGKKVRIFYKEQGLDLGESFAKLTNHQIGELVQKWNVDYLTVGPVVAMLLEAPGVVKIVRKMVGSTFPQDASPGTIRGDYSYDSPFLSDKLHRPVYTMIHASGSPKEAEFERQLWFKESEIHSYKRVEELLMRGE